MVSNNKIDKIMEGLSYTKEIVNNPFNNNKIVWYRNYDNLISRREINKILIKISNKDG